MDIIAWISFVVGILSLIISIIVLIQQNRDKARLKITSILPTLIGSKISEQQWSHKVSGIEIVIENNGSRPAVKCNGVLTFPLVEAIPLYRVLSNHTVDLNDKEFTIQPDSKITLVGA